MTRSPDAPLAFEPGRPSPPPAYAEHFGLARAPFDSTSDPQLLYQSRSYGSVQAQLAEALKRRETLVVLTGRTGTGKTTLCGALVHGLPPPTFISEIVNPFLASEDLLKQILIDFGAVSSDAAAVDKLASLTGHDLLLALRRFLEGSPASARAVIVVDDAHQLQPRVLRQLRSLANIHTTSGKALQILLVGQPELNALLQHPEVRPLNERIVRRCQLDPLTPNEVLPYVEHRLAAAVARSDAVGGPFSELTFDSSTNVTIRRAAWKHLASLSQGVPRALNLLGDRALDVAYERATHDIDRDVVAEAAKRLGLRLPFALRLRARTVGVLATIAVVGLTSAGLWMAARSTWRPDVRWLSTLTTRIAARPKNVAAAPPAAPRLATPAGPAQGEPPKVEVLETANSFALLVASLKSRKNADETVTALAALSLPAFVRADGAWYLVLVGPYITSTEANDALERIPRRRFPDAHMQRQTTQSVDR